jgi:hypothetical protein
MEFLIVVHYDRKKHKKIDFFFFNLNCLCVRVCCFLFLIEKNNIKEGNIHIFLLFYKYSEIERERESKCMFIKYNS